MTQPLDLTADVVDLTRQLCDIESVSRDEGRIADAVEAALSALPHLAVTRHGHTVVARTELGRAERVVLAGHLDTVPLTSEPTNLPTRVEERAGEEVLWGRGTVDMKGGVAVQLKAAALAREPVRDLTYLFYEAEEIEEVHNGLHRLAQTHPELLEADFAVLLEPTDGVVEGGCKGTMRVDVLLKGIAAHSARPWNGHNAIHDAHDVLARLAAHEEQTVVVDGLEYHEALQAVSIEGGIAGNVIPDACTVRVNYRFAPDKTAEEAMAYVASVLPGHELRRTDLAVGARPGLDLPAARDFVAALDVPVRAKEGWTDVARFAALGIPAVNFGPGDPNLAHHDDERCPTASLRAAETAMLRWLA